MICDVVMSLGKLKLLLNMMDLNLRYDAMTCDVNLIGTSARLSKPSCAMTCKSKRSTPMMVMLNTIPNLEYVHGVKKHVSFSTQRSLDCFIRKQGDGCTTFRLTYQVQQESLDCSSRPDIGYD